MVINIPELFIDILTGITFIWCGFYFMIYYNFIYLNRIEKKYNIEKTCSDNLFARQKRVRVLMEIALFRDINFSHFWSQIFKSYEKDWYGRQYIEKMPYDVIKKYRTAFFMLILGFTMMFVPDFLDYIGRTFNIYFKS